MSHSTHPRLVITGAGAITNLGLTAASTWEAMRAGRSGISAIEGQEFSTFPGRWGVEIGGQIKNFEVGKFIDFRESKRMDRFSQFGLAAAIEAVGHSGIDFSKEDPERCGVIVGSGIGGIETIEVGENLLREKGPDRVSPFTVPKLMANAAAGNISIRFGLQGPASTHATACASSGHAIGDAMHVLRRGEADVMVVGGAEAAIGPICVAAFAAMKALSTRNGDPTRASRPFDAERDGFVLAEGAAMFVLETEEHARKRGANILCEMVGYANSCDAYHITAPDERGRGAARSMRWALRDAGLNASQIDYINAHGTSTPLGDKAEVEAVLSIFGDHIRRSAGGKAMMSSTKSMHGHCLGASGAVEMVACMHAVRDGIIAPTINLEKPDEGFDVDLVPHHARERKIKYAMNNTFGFGGHNCSLIVGRYE
ncbi:MAG: beta-ketoacyl-ACP synthase II [Planctomycetaceae bacterium]|nr:beta-ketoacyl-ACP synthase II [Phycisphaerales bacterium]MCE2654618.1 beta-ketoacyl-ACP synthase II [Planctomycetaceae bacterium]